MKVKTNNDDKFIIGNMVIFVDDDVKAKLKGDYSYANLVKEYPEVFDYETGAKCLFLEGSVMCVDDEGLHRWAEKTHPSKIAECDVEKLKEQIEKMSRRIEHMTDYLIVVAEMLNDEVSHKHRSLFGFIKRIFKK